MKRLRFRFIVLISWLFLIFLVDHVSITLVISNVTYYLTAVIMLVILLTRRLGKRFVWAILVTSLGLFLATIMTINPYSRATDSLIVIYEVIVIAITIFLTYRVSQVLIDFEKSVDKITIGQLDRLHAQQSEGEGVLYREVRRARNHKRPLTLLAVSVEEKSIKPSINKIIQETQAAMAKHYALAGISKVLCNSLEDCDVIVQRQNHFIIGLPETKPENLPSLIDRLRRKIRQDIGLEIKVGIASLPQNGFTFEGLVDKATLEMLSDQEQISSIELSHMDTAKIKN